MHGSRCIGIFSLIAPKWPHLSKHRRKIYTNNRHKRQIDRERMHNDQFPKWFESHVDCLRLEGDKQVTTDLRLLARGPSKVASSFSKFVINGFRFRTKDLDKKSKTQNSGVVVTAKTSSFASTKDIRDRMPCWPVESDAMVCSSCSTRWSIPKL